jgi:competence ComEA-like helix-hairpin-helix protein
MPLGLRLIAHLAALAALAVFGVALGRTLRDGTAADVVGLAFVAVVIAMGLRRLYFVRPSERPARGAAAPAGTGRRAGEEEAGPEPPLWASAGAPAAAPAPAAAAPEVAPRDPVHPLDADVRPDAAGPRVDINAASAKDLQRLPGVGPVAAQRIVDEREAGGPFRSVEDLVRVPGIGPARARVLAPYVETGSGSARRN